MLLRVFHGLSHAGALVTHLSEAALWKRAQAHGGLEELLEGDAAEEQEPAGQVTGFLQDTAP